MKKTSLIVNVSLNDSDESAFISCTKRKPTSKLYSPKQKRTKNIVENKLSSPRQENNDRTRSKLERIKHDSSGNSAVALNPKTIQSDVCGSEDLFKPSPEIYSSKSSIDDSSFLKKGVSKLSGNLLKIKCPFCCKQFDSTLAHISHVKQCAKKKNISTSELIAVFQPNSNLLEDTVAHPVDKSCTLNKPTLERFGFTSAIPIGSKKGKLVRSKFPVLKSRTAEDRLKLLTEKAAVVLLDEEKNCEQSQSMFPPTKPAEISQNKMPVLWEIGANEDETSWYIDNLNKFVSPKALKPEITAANVIENATKLNSSMHPLTPESIFSEFATEDELAEDWSQIVNKPELSDISLLTRDGLVYLHSLVLRVRCPSFFASNYEDICSKSSSEHFITFLKYVYTGKLNEVTSNDVKPLLQLSKSFGCLRLHQILTRLPQNQSNYLDYADTVPVNCEYNAEKSLNSSTENSLHDNDNGKFASYHNSNGGFVRLDSNETDTQLASSSSSPSDESKSKSTHSTAVFNIRKDNEKNRRSSANDLLPRRGETTPDKRVPKIVINPLSDVKRRSNSNLSRLNDISAHLSYASEETESTNSKADGSDLADTALANPICSVSDTAQPHRSTVLVYSNSLEYDDEVTQIPSSLLTPGNYENHKTGNPFDIFGNETNIVLTNDHDLANIDTVPNTVDLTQDSPDPIEDENSRLPDPNIVSDYQMEETDALERTKLINYVDHQQIINRIIVEDIEKTELEESQSERVKLMNLSRNSAQIEKDLFEDDEECAIVSCEPKPAHEVIDVSSDSTCNADQDTQLATKSECQTVCDIPYFSPGYCVDYFDYSPRANCSVDCIQSQSLVTGRNVLRTPRKVLRSSTPTLDLRSSTPESKIQEKYVMNAMSSVIEKNDFSNVILKTPSPSKPWSQISSEKPASLVRRRRSSAAQQASKKIVRRSLKSLNDRSKNEKKNESVSQSIIAKFENSWSEPQATAATDRLPPSHTPVLQNCQFVEISPAMTPSVICADKVTPRPDFIAMKTMSLKKNLQKYGLKKGLGKTKARKILAHIYDELHPIINTDTGKLVKVLTPDATVKEKRKVNPKKRAKSSPGLQKGKSLSKEKDSFRIQNPSTPTKSAVDLDSSFTSNVSDGDVEFAELENEILTQASSTSLSVTSAVQRFLKENRVMRLSVLTYQPIWVEELRRAIQIAYSAKYKLTDIIDCLDKMCITFRSESQLVNNKKRNERKKQRRSPKKKKSVSQSPHKSAAGSDEPKQTRVN